MENKISNRKYLIQIWISIASLLLFAATFIVGTFNDEAIAGVLFYPENTIAAAVTSCGPYPFFASAVLFIGALFERAIHSGSNKAVKIILCIVCVLTAAFIGFIGSGAVTDKNCLAIIFPMLEKNYLIKAVIAIVIIYPLFFIGYHFAKKSDDKLLTGRIMALIIVMALSFAIMQVLKGVFNRPRYRTAVLGYEGIGFVPWYSPVTNTPELIQKFDLAADEFRSFPSGHSILSVSTIYILPSLSWIFPKLKNKQIMMTVIGLVFCIIIIMSRMILGAHYLSDVSAGAIISTIISIVFFMIQMRISSKENKE